ncbi:hypothetical protein MCOR30_007676 [Pyricularia oryzae]|nr:hypothetical protein MCOR30_007676 [Pyricularia oryzae]
MPSDHSLRDAEEDTHQDAKRELADIFGSIQKLPQVCSHLKIESDKLVDPEILIEDWPQVDFPISHGYADYILLVEGDQEGLTGRGLDLSNIRLRNPQWDSFLEDTILPTILPKLGLESVKLEPPVLRIQGPGTQRYSLLTEKREGHTLNGSISAQDSMMARPIAPSNGLLDRLEHALRCYQSSDPGAFCLLIPLPMGGHYFDAGTQACHQLANISHKAGFHMFLAGMTHTANENDPNVGRDDPIAWSISLSDIRAGEVSYNPVGSFLRIAQCDIVDINLSAETKFKQHEIDSLSVRNHDPKCYWALDYSEDGSHDSLTDDEDEDEDEDVYDCTCRKTVHHQVIVFVPQQHLDRLLPAVAEPDHVDNLVRLVLPRCREVKEWDEELDSALVRFFTACVKGENVHQPDKTLGWILRWARGGFEEGLYDACLEAGALLPNECISFYSGLGAVIEDDLSGEISYTRVETALCSMLHGLVSQVDKVGLTSLDSILSRLQEEISCHRLRDKFRAWKEKVLRRELRRKYSFDDSDLCFVVKTLDNSGRLLSSMLPLETMKTRSTHHCLLEFLSCAFRKNLRIWHHTSGDFQSLYKQLIDGNEKSLALRGSDIKKTWSTSPHHSGSWFISIVVQSLQQGLLPSLLPIIKSTCPVFDIGLPRDGTLAFRDMSIAGFLGDMCQSLQDASSPPDKKNQQFSTPVTVISAEESKAVFETLLRHGVLRAMPTSHIAESFTGWPIASRGCRKPDCVDCAVLDALLGHKTVIVARFHEKSLRGGLGHLIGQLTKKTAEWPALFKYSVTGEMGSRTVIITKQEDDLRAMAQRNYDYAMRSLRRRVAPLKNDYMKQILGRELYGELVLLGDEDEIEATECDQGLTGTDSDCDSESTKTCSDVAEPSASSLKRPARSSPGPDSRPKRQKTD